MKKRPTMWTLFYVYPKTLNKPTVDFGDQGGSTSTSHKTSSKWRLFLYSRNLIDQEL